MSDRNAYLGSLPHAPCPLDLAHATVEGIAHEDFAVKLRTAEGGPGLVLVLASGTRRHSVRPRALNGTESMMEILALALNMIQLALSDDAVYRFKFRGSPIFARPSAP